MAGPSRYTVIGPLPRGSNNTTLLALREVRGERQGVVLRPIAPDVQVPTPPEVPGLVPFLGTDVVEGSAYALYEFVPGVSLREFCDQYRVQQRRPPLGLAGRVVLDAARIVSALNTHPQGMVHGCLQDGAVLVGFDGQTRVIDAGLDRPSRFDAPEVARREAPTVRADVYALAAMMHAACTGFGGTYANAAVRGPASSDLPPPSKHHADAPPQLDAALWRALVSLPGARAATVKLFADELERALGPKLFTREQVGEQISQLFGSRVAAIKSLVAKAAAPSSPRPAPSRAPEGRRQTMDSEEGPRPSRPAARRAPPTAESTDEVVVQPEPAENRGATRAMRASVRPSRPSAPRPAPEGTQPGYPMPQDPDDEARGPEPEAAQVDLSGAPSADLGLEDAPTTMRPRVTGDFPKLQSPAPPAKRQSAAEKARARGQERIATMDLTSESAELLRREAEEDGAGDAGEDFDGEPAPDDDGLEPLSDPDLQLGAVEHEPTQVKRKPAMPAARAAPTHDVPVVKAKGAGALKKLFATFLVLVAVGGAVSYVLRPWRGKRIPPWVPPQLQQKLLADGALPFEDPVPEDVVPPDAQALPDAGEAAEEGADGGEAAVADALPDGGAELAVPVPGEADGGAESDAGEAADAGGVVDAGEAAAAGAPDAGDAGASGDGGPGLDAGSAVDAGAVAGDAAELPGGKKGKRRNR